MNDLVLKYVLISKHHCAWLYQTCRVFQDINEHFDKLKTVKSILGSVSKSSTYILAQRFLFFQRKLGSTTGKK